MNNTQATFGDKERMNDLLFGEKQLCTEYCSFLCEAATPEVVRTLSTLLTDTHDAQHTLFQEMNSRGWYPVTKAEEQKIMQAKQKFAATLTKV